MIRFSNLGVGTSAILGPGRTPNTLSSSSLWLFFPWPHLLSSQVGTYQYFADCSGGNFFRPLELTVCLPGQFSPFWYSALWILDSVDSPDPQLHLFNFGSLFILSTSWPESSLKTGHRSNSRTNCICFPSFRDPCPFCPSSALKSSFFSCFVQIF